MTEPESGAPKSRRSVIAVFTSHWLAMVGLGLVMTAIIAWACLVPAQLRQGQDNPYVGLATMVVGGVLVFGAVLAAFGLHLGRRKVERRIAAAMEGGGSPWRRFLLFMAVTSLVNLLIASQATLRAVHTMETQQFCTSCHVMKPEGRAFPQGPHAAILCVECHVGDGTRGYVKSKMQGAHQLYAVLTDSVEKPIKPAIEAGLMVPSAETCEGCHWKEKPAGAKLELIQSYADDEANTPSTTLLTMNIGGTRMGGIHGVHNSKDVEIQFVAVDPKRQDIPLVEVRNTKTGETRTYVRKGADAAALKNAPRIKMQCFDCHNRVAHVFQMPDRAVDRAIMLGRMSDSLPFLKKKSVEILKTVYPSSEAAEGQIPSALAAYYRTEQPEVSKTRAADIAEAGAVLADIYSRNVFPDLGVTWGTYPDNGGHQDWPGCFRCHDEEHAAPTGETITKNCFRCHFPAAVDETNPEVLKLLGVDRLLKKLK